MLQPNYLSRTVSKIMSDKRDCERVRAAFSGIVMKDGEFVCHCIIRDVSITGMRLEFPDKNKMPDLFEIKTPAMPDVLEVRSVWKKNKEMGVEFLLAEAQEEVAPEQGVA